MKARVGTTVWQNQTDERGPTMSDFNKSRRVFLRTAALGAAAVPLAGLAVGSSNAYAAKPHAEDGHALGYVNDSTTTDSARHQKGQHCSNCVFWAGENSGGWGTCRHPKFADVQVNQNGWCNSYAPAA